LALFLVTESLHKPIGGCVRRPEKGAQADRACCASRWGHDEAQTLWGLCGCASVCDEEGGGGLWASEYKKPNSVKSNCPRRPSSVCAEEGGGGLCACGPVCLRAHTGPLPPVTGLPEQTIQGHKGRSVRPVGLCGVWRTVPTPAHRVRRGADPVWSVAHCRL
jgi:hypothetical protein